MQLLRQELKLHEAGANWDGSPAWHIADPVRNLFFRIGWLEVEMLKRWQLADAQTIANDISANTPLAPDVSDVERFAMFLQQHSLVRVASGMRSKKPLWQWLLDNYLFIRIPLVRPQRWLEALLPFVSWLFSRWFFVLTGVAGLLGVALAARQWDRVEGNFAGAMSWDGITGFAIALLASKLIHEMGHALTSVRHGVRVGHMGVALLVMWPMPYTDTGESWKLSDPRHRLAIASAGIASEIMLAAWCTLLWNFTPDGNFRNALFFLASTAWILALAVNASPFMRFDGYFMLSDALDYPGLHERAGRWAKRSMRRVLLGIEEPAPETLEPPMRRFLTAFAFATWIYRLVLFVGIAVLVYHAFFKALGILLFAVEMSVFVVRPVARELKQWWSNRKSIRMSRIAALASLVVAFLLAICVPWSSSVHAYGVLRAGSEQSLYAPYPAQLRSFPFANGAQIKRGDVIAELDEPSQLNERDKARALESAYERTARGALGAETEGAARLAMAEQFASRWQAERVARDAELARLKLVAQQDGQLRDVDVTLHAGSWVNAGTPLAWLVDARRWRVEALIAEKDARRLAKGATARVYVRGGTAAPLEGQVVGIDNNPVQKLPHLLLAQPHGGPLALNPGTPAQQLKPAESLYRVMVEGSSDKSGIGAAETSVHLVSVSIQGQRTSVAQQWFASALSVLIQQADF